MLLPPRAAGADQLHMDPAAQERCAAVVQECQRIQAELLELIGSLDLPPNFLDEIILNLGGQSMVRRPSSWIVLLGEINLNLVGQLVVRCPPPGLSCLGRSI